MHYKIQLYTAIAICILFIVKSEMFKNTPTIFKLLLCYTAFNGAYFSMLNPFLEMGFVSNANLRIISGTSFVYTSLLVVSIFSLTEFHFRCVCKYLVYLALLSSIICIVKKIFGLQAWAIGLNTSTEGTYLAIMLPIILFYDNTRLLIKYPLLKICPIIAIVLTGSSVGIFGAIFSMLAYLLAYKKNIKVILYSIIPISIIIFLFYLNMGNELFSDSNRIQQWKITVDWFFKKSNLYIGNGIGSYWGFGSFIQKIYNSHLKELFTNAHNDWLQILFELGFIGLFLSIVNFTYLLIKSFKNPILFSSIATFGFVSAMNMPLRYSITCLSGLMVVRLIYNTKILRGGI